MSLKYKFVQKPTNLSACKWSLKYASTSENKSATSTIKCSINSQKSKRKLKSKRQLKQGQRLLILIILTILQLMKRRLESGVKSSWRCLRLRKRTRRRSKTWDQQARKYSWAWLGKEILMISLLMRRKLIRSWESRLSLKRFFNRRDHSTTKASSQMN